MQDNYISEKNVYISVIFKISKQHFHLKKYPGINATNNKTQFTI